MVSSFASPASDGQVQASSSHFHTATSDLDHVARLLHKAAYGLERRSTDPEAEADRILVYMLSDEEFEIPSDVKEPPIQLERDWITGSVVRWTYDVLVGLGYKPKIILAGGTYALFVP